MPVQLHGIARELGSPAIRRHLGLRDRTHLRDRYLDPCLKAVWIEATIPEKPRSRLQTYRLIAKGRDILALLATPKWTQP